MLLDIRYSILSTTLCSMSALINLSLKLVKSPACMQPGMHALDHNREGYHSCEEGTSWLRGEEFEAWQGPQFHLASSK